MGMDLMCEPRLHSYMTRFRLTLPADASATQRVGHFNNIGRPAKPAHAEFRQRNLASLEQAFWALALPFEQIIDSTKTANVQYIIT